MHLFVYQLSIALISESNGWSLVIWVQVRACDWARDEKSCVQAAAVCGVCWGSKLTPVNGLCSLFVCFLTSISKLVSCSCHAGACVCLKGSICCPSLWKSLKPSIPGTKPCVCRSLVSLSWAFRNLPMHFFSIFLFSVNFGEFPVTWQNSSQFTNSWNQSSKAWRCSWQKKQLLTASTHLHGHLCNRLDLKELTCDILSWPILWYLGAAMIVVLEINCHNLHNQNNIYILVWNFYFHLSDSSVFKKLKRHQVLQWMLLAYFFLVPTKVG